MPSVNPYLNFAGTCEQAFEHYRSIFGGEFVDYSPFSDLPDGPTGAEADWLMHVSLPLGDGQVLMGSDVPSEMGGVSPGTTVYVSVSPDSAEDGRRIFEGLAEGGSVQMPYERQFWGADFGQCVDRWGIGWMVNFTHPEG